MTKTAFITGITGMVGSHLAEYLIENTDWDIVGLIRWRSPLDNIRSLIDSINNKDRVKLVYGDLNDSLSIDSSKIDTSETDTIHITIQSDTTVFKN